MPDVPQMPIPQPRLADLRGDYSIPRAPDLSPEIKAAESSADITAQQEGVRQATDAQTGNPQSMLTPMPFSSAFGDAYNHTVGTIYTTQKQAQLDDGLNKLHAQFPNDPQGFSNGVEAFKSTFMSDVPTLQQAPLMDALTTKAQAYTNQVWNDHVNTLHDQAVVSSDNRLASLKQRIYQAVLTGGDAALNTPATQHDLAEHQTLLEAGQKTQLGGPLYAPHIANNAAIDLHEQVVEAGLKHTFSITPGLDGKAQFVAGLVANGVPGVRPEKQQGIISNLNQDLKDYRMADSYQTATLSATIQQIHAYTSAGLMPPDELVAGARLQLSKVPTPRLQNELDRTLAVGDGMRGFTDQPLTTMTEQRDATLTRIMSNAPANAGNYRQMIEAMETNHGDNKYGFTDRTMTDLQTRHPELQGLNKNDDRVLDAFTAENRATMQAALGRASTNQEMYFAHFLGAGGAIKFMNAGATSPAMSAASQEAVEANPSIFTPGATVQDVKNKIIDRIGRTGVPGGNVGDSYDIELLKLQTAALEGARKELSAGNAIDFAVHHNAKGVPASTLAPVDFNDPQSVSQRVEAARLTSSLYGIPVSPLLPQESKALAAAWPTMTVADQLTKLDNFSKFKMRPDEEKALYTSLAKDDITLPTLAHMMASGDPAQRSDVQRVLAGHQFLHTDKDAVDHEGVATRAIDGVLSKIYTPEIDPGGQTLKAVQYMAMGHYAQDRHEAGKFDLTADEATTAAGAAVARMYGYKKLSEMPVINGSTIQPFEKSITNARANDIWKQGASDDLLKTMNQGQLPTDNTGTNKVAIDANHMASNGFPLPTANPGEYVVGMLDKNGNPFRVKGADGKDFIWKYEWQKARFNAVAGSQSDDESGDPFVSGRR